MHDDGRVQAHLPSCGPKLSGWPPKHCYYANSPKPKLTLILTLLTQTVLI